MSEKTTKQKKYSSRPRRAVIVGGVRSPFVKAFGPYLTMDTITLATAVVKALLEKYPLPQGSIDSLVWGGVILPSACPNTAREIVIDANLPRSTEAFTVSRACASGLQAITTAAMAIERGDADIVIAGGSDSTSNAEIQLPQKLVHELAPLAFGKAKPSDLIGSLARLNFAKDVLPRAPKIAERSTGQTMGEAAEDMARRNEISREAQDNLAFESHQRAANAVTTGRFDDEVVPIQCQNGEWVHQDQLIRASTTREKLSKLRSAFAKNGSLTA